MKDKYKITLFIVEMIYMTLELIASRILSPYFGNTNLIWTCIIGIILLSTSIGNYYGGILADRNENERYMKIILFFSSISVLMISLSKKAILDAFSSIIANISIGAIISTLILFFIPSMLIGMINPIILKNEINNNNVIGKSSGRIYALSTFGGICGTFFSGFYLIPKFSNMSILFVLSIILLVLSMLFKIEKNRDTFNIMCILFILINVILFINNYKENVVMEEKVLLGETDVSLSFDTQYGSSYVYNRYYNDNIIRELSVDNTYQSATYIENDKIYDLVYEYTKYYDLMFKGKDINNVLMIGGGAFSYPKYFISKYKDKNMDVVEIDGDIINIAKKYFYLDKLYEDYDADKRLNIYNEDGRTYLNRNTKKYDAILNDAFLGVNPPKTLTTREAVIRIKDSLNKDGLYLTNIGGSLEGVDSRFLQYEVKTLNTEFKNVYTIPITTNKMDMPQNIMVIATDMDLDINNAYDLNISSDAIILTDDYCPIDNLFLY